jgi:hypothetical protein
VISSLPPTEVIPQVTVTGIPQKTTVPVAKKTTYSPISPLTAFAALCGAGGVMIATNRMKK